MLLEVFKELDEWIKEQNRTRFEDGIFGYQQCHIRVVGQMALLEAKLDLTLGGTLDVDVYADYEHAVKKQFEALLRIRGKELDPVGHEAWMPKETEYEFLYDGIYVKGLLAKPDYVLIAKALKAPKKNHALIVEYLAKKPTQLFLDLATKYQVNLEGFLQ